MRAAESDFLFWEGNPNLRIAELSYELPPPPENTKIFFPIRAIWGLFSFIFWGLHKQVVQPEPCLCEDVGSQPEQRSMPRGRPFGFSKTL